MADDELFLFPFKILLLDTVGPTSANSDVIHWGQARVAQGLDS